MPHGSDDLITRSLHHKITPSLHHSYTDHFIGSSYIQLEILKKKPFINLQAHIYMSIIIRKAIEEDVPVIHQLVRELAEYEKGLHNVTTSAESYRVDFKNGEFDAFVAERDGEVIGMALYYPMFSTWRGRMLYLEDFIVKDSERGAGVGALLFDAFIEEAKRQKVPLVKWQVLKWNEPAIKFYKKYDVVLDDEWMDGKIYF